MVHPEFQTVHEQYEDLPVIHRDLGRHALQGAPLGPDSLLWRYMDNRMAFMASAGIVQLMIPAIGAGVAQHSNFFNEPLERIVRSIDPIGRSVFEEPKKAQETGKLVQSYHSDIKGTDHTGQRYHALSPQTWADTHLTFVNGVFQVADRFSHHKLSWGERQQLYAETITWYQNYGVTDRLLPPDYESYEKRWDEMTNDIFTMTEPAKRTLEMAVKGQIPRPNVVPKPVWSMLKLPMMPAGDMMGKIIISGLPEKVRKDNNIPYSNFDEGQVQLFELAVKHNWRMMPDFMRYPPQAYDALLREGKQKKLSDHAYALGSRALKSPIHSVRSLFHT